MSEETEKLIEWVAKYLRAYYELGHRRATPTKFSEEGAKDIIARIGKAYADGMLLPGEAWRAQAWVEDGIEHFPRGRVEVRPPIDALENFPRMMAFDVIALRKEEPE